MNLVLHDNSSEFDSKSRNISGRLISADSDWEAILAWLSRCKNENTRASYLKEVDRFYRWYSSNNKKLSNISHEDFINYETFLGSPPPEWIGKKLPRNHPDWKPFSGPLSGVSIRQAMVIIDGMMSWMVEARYIESNPLSLRPIERAGKNSLKRFLSKEEIEEVFSLISSKKDFFHYRKKWFFTLLTMSGLRISEACSIRFSDFSSSKRDGSFWVRVVGKGNKERFVPLSDQLLFELQQFKIFIQGLKPRYWPGVEVDDLPALPSLRSCDLLNRKTAHSIIKDVFNDVRVHIEGGEHKGGIFELLDEISAHWLRHSYGTMLADNDVDLRIIKENMGHSSIQSTQIYLHTDDAQRYRATKDLVVGKS